MTRRAVALALVALFPLGACSSVAVQLPPAPRITATGDGAPSYKLEPADVLEAHFAGNPDFNEQSVIGPDGKVTFQYAQNIQAGGETLSDVKATLLTDYKISDPRDLEVVLRSQAGYHYYVTGEVTLPSEVITSGPVTALAAVSRAGGFKITAQQDELVLLRRDQNGHVHVYAIDAAAAEDGSDPSADVLLQPYDVLYVPRDRVSNVSLVFEKLRNALPLSGTFSFVNFMNSSTNP